MSDETTTKAEATQNRADLLRQLLENTHCSGHKIWHDAAKAVQDLIILRTSHDNLLGALNKAVDYEHSRLYHMNPERPVDTPDGTTPQWFIDARPILKAAEKVNK
ncbi:hypothetical protein LCGC14_1674420 [marine sediment metagenome]|uniref:Uncharacterized protein n=1 Tax=marine sediment metagenome TaxID=412755 RepID=A0A0F9K6A0_9ZZZZ